MQSAQEPSNIEQEWPLNSLQDIIKIMQAVLSRELKVVPLDNARPIKTSIHSQIHIPPDDERAAILRIGEEGFNAASEHLWTIGFNENFELCFLDLIATGDKLSVKFPILKAFRGFVYYKAYYAVFVHNHPAGEPLPFSKTDKDTTTKLIRAGNMLDIIVYDHMVIDPQLKTISMLDEGIFEALEKDAIWADLEAEEVAEVIRLKDEIIAKREEELKKQAEKMGRLATIAQNQDQLLTKQAEEIAKLREELAKK
ncbi:MAG: hypothetical protein FWE37_00965 [Spirochaetaceae bacterium]|nr:hypothetical protein [Spirochaetaceae bacterium]